MSALKRRGMVLSTRSIKYFDVLAGSFEWLSAIVEAKRMTEPMSRQVALERIEKAFHLREIELDLSRTGILLGSGVIELPAEIGKLVWLEKLNLESAGIEV